MISAYQMRKALLGVAAVGMSLVAGCASGGGQASEKVAIVDGIQAFADELQTAQNDIDQVVSSISQLQAGGDLKAAFASYNASIAKMEKAADRVKSRRERMSADRDEYIARWQKELETIQNPDVQAALVERKGKISQNFDRLSGSVQKIRDTYTPLMRDLKEAQTVLSLDLNPQGVKALTPAFNRATSDAATLKQALGSLQSELQSIIGSMTPPPPAKQ